jgi:amino acid adenylation domain-containing protein
MTLNKENGTEVLTVSELVSLRATQQPNVTFLVSPETGRQLTFGELKEQSRQLYARLRELGLEPGDKIAFLLDNGVFTAQLFIAAIASGFVAVPLNVRAGVSQLSYTLDHSDAKLVFVEPQYEPLLKEVLAVVPRKLQIEVVGVDQFPSGLPAAAEPPKTAASDVALLMYTSGSTGMPKAAVHTQGSIMAQARNSVLSHELTARDRSLLVLPLYHINAECVTLIPTLLSAGTVVVPHKFSVANFWDWLEEHRITWTAVVPTIISQLLDWKDPKFGQRQESFDRIRFMRSSSAPLSPALHREFIEKFKLPLIQAMGCSEGGNVFSNPCPPRENKIGSPGLPWGFETRIVNREGQDLPPNEPGEVFLRGPAMTTGYYKDPVQTQSAFDTEGWFHTGDLAYRDDDGYFFVVGRSKELIIKGGMNIAPKQIDEVIESHPAILEAAVVGVPDRYVGEDIVGFAVLRDGMDLDEQALLTFCEEKLGHFKTPTRIHFVEDLPKGPSGKILRLRLVEEAAKPSVARSVTMGGDGASSESRGPLPAIEELEKTIIEVWTELLGKDGIDSRSNFFALGGHSLMAIQSLSKLRAKVPVVLSLTDFFENSTVTQLATVLRKRLASAPAPEAGDGPTVPLDETPIPMRDKSQPCPLSPAQQRLWFIDQLVPEAIAYNESEAVRLRGDLNVDALEKGFNIIVGRHELLHSTIESKDGQPFFVAHPDWKLVFKRLDVSNLPEAAREAEVAKLLISEPRVPYQLDKIPGIRVTLVRVAAQDHVLILQMSHLICDWSSEGVMWRELSALYRSLLRGEPLVLPPLPIQHGDYAAWQQTNNVPANFKEGLEFWKKTLAGAPELIEIPTDRPRPAANTYRGARKRYFLTGAQAEAMRHLSRREKTSLFTCFGAGLNALLHRYNRSGDVLLGIPLADRDRQELQTMIGFLLHMQVLRTAVEDEMSFSSLVARVQKGTVDMFSHRAVPFDLIVREQGHERNLAYSPLFQVMFNWRDKEQELAFIGLDGLKIESLLAEANTAKFDLTFMMTDEGDQFVLEMEYSTDLFNEDRIDRMVGHYFTLLDSAAANPEQKIAQLPLLTAPEREQVLVDWNRTQTDYPKGRYVHDLFADQAAKTPDAVAVVFDDKKLTYRELDAKSNQLAHHLRKLGVKADTLVGVCVERSLEMVIGLLGILKAGGAYVPLDPRYPKDRVEFVLKDAAASILLTQTSLAADMPASANAIRLDADWAKIAAESEARLESTTKGTDLAYVIYTSGSTGLPKGVEIPHEAFVNFQRAMQATPGLKAEDVLLAVTTISFDIAGLELFLPLITGAKLVVLSREDATDGFRLIHQLNAHNVTMLQATPATWRLLLDAEWEGNPKLKMLCGGEALPRELADQLAAKGGELWNMYGPTETTVWSTLSRIRPNEPVIHIGRPIGNTEIYILDAQLNPTPIGVPGELHIGGIGLARGYHNRPELTAEKFIKNPFAKDASARIYKTGDLARYLPNGNIEHLGRLDHQVKLRGFRIELGEIEEVLAKHPAIAACTVTAREDAPGDKRLVAYVVNSNGTVKPSELREHLRAKLPDYMIPAAFVTLEKLPLTPNGKVDRKALPKPEIEAVTDQSHFAAPSTETEKALAKIWCDVLHLKQVGLNDNFFDIGGHSVLLLQVHARIGTVTTMKVSVAELFQYPTISALAQHLSKPAASAAGRLSKVRDRARRQAEAWK